MPRLSSEIKQQVKELPKEKLEEVILKMAAKDKSFYDFLQVNYLDKSGGETDLFEKTKVDLDKLFVKSYKGYAEQLKLVKMLNTCIKRVNEFTKVSKNKVFEADLLLYILDEVFGYSNNMFGTCFTTYDTRVGIILRRLVNLVQSKLHPDHLIGYQDKINKYLTILHRISNHIDAIYGLPKSI
jgi:hypothetical protein